MPQRSPRAQRKEIKYGKTQIEVFVLICKNLFVSVASVFSVAKES